MDRDLACGLHNGAGLSRGHLPRAPREDDPEGRRAESHRFGRILGPGDAADLGRDP